MGRPESWLAPPQAPFVLGESVSFHSIDVDKHPLNTCCISCFVPRTTRGMHLTPVPMDPRAHSRRTLAELQNRDSLDGDPRPSSPRLFQELGATEALVVRCWKTGAPCICQLISQGPDLLPEAELATGSRDPISNALRGGPGSEPASLPSCWRVTLL